MEITATKRVTVQQFKAYCERGENNWDEFIVVYDKLDKEVARSSKHHPEGNKSFNWNGFEFIALGHSGSPRTECYVKVTDNVFFELPGR